jgi:hypothetical protein
MTIRGRELFELSMLGGAVERRYRHLRPEPERLPWGTLQPENYSEEVVLAARKTWTEAAFQEYRTGHACAVTLRALIEARAPLDLIALAGRFPVDELVHVELCCRLANELGGGIAIEYDSAQLTTAPSSNQSALMRAAELVVRNFCVGEACSIPILHASWKAARHPLIRGVLGIIVKDEAAHGQFGWLFLDWAEEQLGPDDVQGLAAVAAEAIAQIRANWAKLEPRTPRDADTETLGWMQPQSYLKLARRALDEQVIALLRARGLHPKDSSP